MSGWRLLVPLDVMQDLFWQAAGPLVSDDKPSAVLLAGMMACAADGMLVNLVDTPENRKAFGCAGTAAQEGEGSGPVGAPEQAPRISTAGIDVPLPVSSNTLPDIVSGSGSTGSVKYQARATD